jgi:hypothetical protein
LIARGRRSSKEGSEGKRPVSGFRLAGAITVDAAISAGKDSGPVAVPVDGGVKAERSTGVEVSEDEGVEIFPGFGWNGVGEGSPIADG